MDPLGEMVIFVFCILPLILCAIPLIIILFFRLIVFIGEPIDRQINSIIERSRKR
jgi:hypothetical protein